MKNILSMFIPTSWELYAIIFVIGLGTGGWGVHKLYQIGEANRAKEAMTTTLGGVALMNNAGSKFLAKQKEKDKQNAKTIANLQQRLKEPHGCDNTPIPLEWVLGNDLSGASGPGPKPGSPSAPVEDYRAKCDVIVTSCELNRQQACEPAADQADAIRDTYNELKKKFNKKSWW